METKSDIKIDSVVIPGDNISHICGVTNKSNVVLGPGLYTIKDKDDIIVNKCGILRRKKPDIYWVDTHYKRYVPVKGDHVIGIITGKAGDYFKVDIGCSEQASLYFLDFEGATKKNRQHLNVGDAIYALCIIADKDLETQVSCMDANGKQGKMGLLKSDGFLFRCNLNLIRKITNPKCCILNLLGKEINHEIAIGMNGRVWVRSNSIRSTVAIGNSILEAEHLTNDEIKVKCKEILKHFK
uniref:Exosome complex component RRP40 n=1 Tax=Clastoptera arizonana TaxID=38151 RepID=A0A1B6CL21_9HEMI